MQFLCSEISLQISQIHILSGKVMSFSSSCFSVNYFQDRVPERLFLKDGDGRSKRVGAGLAGEGLVLGAAEGRLCLP